MARWKALLVRFQEPYRWLRDSKISSNGGLAKLVLVRNFVRQLRGDSDHDEPRAQNRPRAAAKARHAAHAIALRVLFQELCRWPAESRSSRRTVSCRPATASCLQPRAAARARRGALIKQELGS